MRSLSSGMVFCCVFGENVSFFEIFASRVTLIQQIPLGQRFCPLKNGPCKRDDLTSEIFYEATTRKWDQAKTTLASAWNIQAISTVHKFPPWPVTAVGMPRAIPDSSANVARFINLTFAHARLRPSECGVLVANPRGIVQHHV